MFLLWGTAFQSFVMAAWVITAEPLWSILWPFPQRTTIEWLSLRWSITESPVTWDCKGQLKGCLFALILSSSSTDSPSFSIRFHSSFRAFFYPIEALCLRFILLLFFFLLPHRNIQKVNEIKRRRLKEKKKFFVLCVFCRTVNENSWGFLETHKINTYFHFLWLLLALRSSPSPLLMTFACVWENMNSCFVGILRLFSVFSTVRKTLHLVWMSIRCYLTPRHIFTSC